MTESLRYFHFMMAKKRTPKREAAKILKDLNRAVMERHRDKRLARHFEVNADTKPGGAYKYRQRTGKYTKTKQHKFGHARPNVFSGALRASVFAKIKITATQHGSKLITRGTEKSRLQTWQKRELEIMSVKERRQEAARYEKDFVKLVRSGRHKAESRKVVK